ncbi:putative membrane protein [Rhodanobacter sp. TND4EL1]
MQRSLPRWLLALFFVVAGMLHFLFIANYMAIMPAWLPWHRALVVISGLCEVAGGLGVLWHATRRWAGYGLIALCVAVLPANVQMLLNAQAAHASGGWLTLLWMRLPLQILLIAWIWHATRRRAD